MFKSLVLSSIIFFFTNSAAQASLVISEILADPPPGLSGDANGDGIGSSSQDEFIEFFNNSSFSLNIEGWSVADALLTRHIFSSGTIIDPYKYLVVFGGGSFSPTVFKQKSSTGALSLNNTSDFVRLFDVNGVLIEEVSYGNLANQDQSIARIQLAQGSAFVLHSEIAFFQGSPYSPGYGENIIIPSSGSVPEPLSATLLSLGLAGCGILRGKYFTKA